MNNLIFIFSIILLFALHFKLFLMFKNNLKTIERLDWRATIRRIMLKHSLLYNTALKRQLAELELTKDDKEFIEKRANVVEIYTGARASGKTTALIRYASENNCNIVVADFMRKKYLSEHIKALGIDNVKVLAYSEVKTYSRGRHEENYVFDDILVSICLANGLPMPKAITICTREKGFTKEEIANMSNEEFKQNEESIMHQIREGLI